MIHFMINLLTIISRYEIDVNAITNPSASLACRTPMIVSLGVVEVAKSHENSV